MKKIEPIIVEQIYNAKVAKVWSAITDKNQMRQWFFETIESFKPEVGFETQFNVQAGEINYPHIWKVTEIIPGQKITLDWKYGGYQGDSSVTFELTSKNNLTKLKLTHIGTESFPVIIRIFLRSGTGGWTYLICKRLKEYLEKNNM